MKTIEEVLEQDRAQRKADIERINAKLAEERPARVRFSFWR